MAKKKDTGLSTEERLEEALVPENEQPYKIADNWVWTRLLGVLAALKNGTTIKQNKEGIGAKVTRIESIQSNLIDFNRVGYIEDITKIKEVDWYLKFDIALSHINSAEHVGKTAIIYDNYLPLVHGMNLLRLRFNESCNPKYFYYFSQSYQYKESILSRINMAVNQVSINQKQLSDIELPLPPLSEQQRIVDRIESLFEKLDHAKELIQDALDSFENRKAAILHKAFTGELTKKWREENGISLESWEEKKLSELCKINPSKINVKELEDDTLVSFIPMPSVSDVLGKIDNPQQRALGEVKKGYTNFSEGDVIFAKITPCMENGKTAIVGKLINGIGYGSTEFHVFRCNKNLNNEYLYHILRNQSFRDEARAVMTGAVGQQRVPKSFLEEYMIYTPKIEEQLEIVKLVNDCFGKEQEAYELYDLIDQIDLMKKSILARAFRGELGTNDPTDENAIELLKRVLESN